MSMNTGKLMDIAEFIKKLVTDPKMNFSTLPNCCDDFISASCKCIVDGCWTWPEIKQLIELFQQDFGDFTLPLDFIAILGMMEVYFGLSGKGEFFSGLTAQAPGMLGMIFADFIGAYSGIWVGQEALSKL